MWDLRPGDPRYRHQGRWDKPKSVQKSQKKATWGFLSMVAKISFRESLRLPLPSNRVICSCLWCLFVKTTSTYYQFGNSTRGCYACGRNAHENPSKYVAFRLVRPGPSHSGYCMVGTRKKKIFFTGPSFFTNLPNINTNWWKKDNYNFIILHSPKQSNLQCHNPMPLYANVICRNFHVGLLTVCTVYTASTP